MTDAVQIALIVGCCGIVTASVPAYFAYRAKKVAEETHAVVNSRMTEFMEMAKKSFKAEGKLEGKAEQKAADKGEKKLAGDLDKTASKYPHHD